MRWAGHVTRMEQMRNANETLVSKHDGNRLLGWPKGTIEDNINVHTLVFGVRTPCSDVRGCRRLGG